jgi:hypothetical protein
VANSKQKPVPEGTKRSPGKSKFSIPRKEAPPIDGSYLDRLFADYDKQTKDAETQDDTANAPVVEALAPAPAADEQSTQFSAQAVHTELPAEDSQPAPTLVPVPFSPAETTTQNNATADSHTQTLQADARPAAERPPVNAPSAVDHAHAPVVEASADVDELVQRLVKLHRLSKGEAGVLRVMVRMCQEHDDNICHIKIPQLMGVTGLKDRQTQRVLKSLAELGLIERLAEYSNADRLGIKYKINIG